MAKQKTVLITGVTGLIGSYLSMIMLKDGYKVYALARPKDNKSAADRVSNVLRFWDEGSLSRNYDNLIVLDGDVVRENLGLDNHSIDILKRDVDEIFHSAAVTQFNWPLEKIREINVRGTKNVLELAVRCNKEGTLKKVNHFSTAYVCGDYKGVFKEDDLDVGQDFDSTYEQSKFEAEKLVETYRKKGLWIDIFRPPLVLGESATGKTTTFQQSVYQLLHMLQLELFDFFPGLGLFVNMVFVDDLCNAICKISSMTSAVNKNYNTFASEAVLFELTLDVSSKYLKFSKPTLVSRTDFIKKNPTPAQKILLKNNIFLIGNEVKLDSKKTNKILKKYSFEFTELNKDLFLKQLKYYAVNKLLM